ncbi:MAG: energy-coupling factor transporter transmembrane component T [Candidatus Bathyarchaeia archaeon]
MSMRVFEGFKFSKLPTPIHSMDPRSKFVMVAGIAATSLMFTELLPLMAVFAAVPPLTALARSFRRWLASMKGASVLAALIFVMNFITGSTLTYSISMMLRFLTLISSFSLFFMTTSPDDLGLALERVGVPYHLTFTFTTAVRLVPTIASDAQTVIDAQKSRGLELEKGNILRRVRNYIPILIPLIVSAIRRSIELAEALESRGFGASKKREPMTTLQLRRSDVTVILLTLALVALATYVKLHVPLPVVDLPIRMPRILPF